MKLTVIGLGHIGGSFAVSLKQAGHVHEVVGVDADASHCQQALEFGIAQSVAPLEEAMAGAHLVALAIPVAAIKTVLPRVLDLVEPQTVVLDLGSTKEAICNAVAQHPKRQQFVATHPIAGTENSGPTAAMNNLFQGKKTIVVEQALSARHAVEAVENLYAALEMEVLYMDAREHDEHLAYISHMSHLTSFSLALSVLRAEKDEDLIFQFAGSGFASTARLGKSSPAMWAPIFLENKAPLLNVLDRYMGILEDFRQAIANNNTEALEATMEEANEIRRILAKGQPEHKTP